MSVYIDGVHIDDIKCWDSKNIRNYVAFDSENYNLNLADGNHELKLVCIGTAQENTPPIFRVDAFDEYTNMISTVSTRDLAVALGRAMSIDPDEYDLVEMERLNSGIDSALSTYLSNEANTEDVLTAYNELVNLEKDLKTADLTIQKVNNPIDINVSYKTDLSTIELPKTVVVETKSKLYRRIDVSWNINDFRNDKAGIQEIQGILVLPSDTKLKNSSDIKANIKIKVDKGLASIKLENLNQIEGKTSKIKAITDPKGLNVLMTFNGAKEMPLTEGEYIVEAFIEDDNYEGSVKDVLIIKKEQEKPEENKDSNSGGNSNGNDNNEINNDGTNGNKDDNDEKENAANNFSNNTPQKAQKAQKTIVKQTNKGEVNTGDHNTLIVWSSIFVLASLITLFILAIKRRKR